MVLRMKQMGEGEVVTSQRVSLDQLVTLQTYLQGIQTQLQLDDLLSLVNEKVDRTQEILTHLDSLFTIPYYQQQVFPNGIYHPSLDRYNLTV